MSQWTDGIAEQRKQKADEQRIQNERSNVEAALLDSGFSYLWSELKKVVPAKCQEVNSAKSIGVQLKSIDDGDELSIVRQDNGVVVKFVRDKRIRAVEISGADLMFGLHTQHIRVRLNGNNFYFTDSGGGQNEQVPKIAEKAIEFLLSA
jgi:hypothetical protein